MQTPCDVPTIEYDENGKEVKTFQLIHIWDMKMKCVGTVVV